MEQEYAKWLMTCPGIRSARTIKATIANFVFVGVLAEMVRQYSPTERAVTENRVKAGEDYICHRMYFLGNLPNKLSVHKTFVWEHNLPMDDRVERSIGEWYLACYSSREFNPSNPFGHWFALHDHATAVYGPYKDWKIDTGEQYVYERIPMTIEYLSETPT